MARALGSAGAPGDLEVALERSCAQYFERDFECRGDDRQWCRKVHPTLGEPARPMPMRATDPSRSGRAARHRAWQAPWAAKFLSILRTWCVRLPSQAGHLRRAADVHKMHGKLSAALFLGGA